MIQFVAVILKDIFEQERNFLWERPSNCPQCGAYKVWGHGFVRALFEGFAVPLFLKRYRCPDCGCVITMRPESHFTRFQSSRTVIRSALEHRINDKKWPPDLIPGRMRHWMVNLRRQIKAYLPQNWKASLMESYDHLLNMGKVPVSRTI